MARHQKELRIVTVLTTEVFVDGPESATRVLDVAQSRELRGLGTRVPGEEQETEGGLTVPRAGAPAFPEQPIRLAERRLALLGVTSLRIAKRITFGHGVVSGV